MNGGNVRVMPAAGCTAPAERPKRPWAHGSRVQIIGPWTIDSRLKSSGRFVMPVAAGRERSLTRKAQHVEAELAGQELQAVLKPLAAVLVVFPRDRISGAQE